MRLQLTLHCPNRSRLAFDYQYALQAAIYRTLERADPAFSHWLHEKGYALQGTKKFKLFTFDLLRGRPTEFDREQNQLVFPSGVVDWQVSFCVDAQVEKFVEGLFKNQTLEIVAANTKVVFQVQSVAIVPEPTPWLPTMRFRAETGICIAEKTETDRYPQYRSPDNAGYESLFLNNLMNKVRAAMGAAFHMPRPESIALKIVSEPKKWSSKTPRADSPKPIQTIGYKFDFELTAPADWLRIGLAAGFGEKNANGFGFCRVIS